jgi:hypothetical protein
MKKMAEHKNTPQNVNKSPDKKKSGKKKSEAAGKATPDKVSKNAGSGIGGTQLGTGQTKGLKKGKVIPRKVRDLG